MKSSRRLLLPLLVLAGCSSDDLSDDRRSSPEFPYVDAVSAAGCAVPEPCEILASDCQQGWLAAMTCLRGIEPMIVPIRIIDEATYISEQQALPVEPRPSPDHWERALVTLGFVEPGAYQFETSDEVVYVGAYYSDESHEITIIDHGLPSDGIYQNSLFLHELVHAAQDQELGLRAFMEALPDSADAVLGARGLVEGEAMFYQTLVLGALNGIAAEGLDLPALFAEQRERRMEEALAAASPYFMAYFSLPYGLGAPFAGRAYDTAGAQGIRDLYADPPLSSRRLLLLDVAGDMELPAAEFLDAAALAGESFTHQYSDSFGAFGLWLYGGSESLDVTLEASAKLRADRFDVLSQGGLTSLVWQLGFDDAASAAAFLDVANTRWPSNAAQGWFDRADGSLVLVASSDSATQALLTSALGL